MVTLDAFEFVSCDNWVPCLRVVDPVSEGATTCCQAFSSWARCGKMVGFSSEFVDPNASLIKTASSVQPKQYVPKRSSHSPPSRPAKKSMPGACVRERRERAESARFGDLARACGRDAYTSDVGRWRDLFGKDHESSLGYFVS